MVIFDFDGVLMDSVDEVAVTAFNSVSDSLAYSLEDLPAGYLKLFKENRFAAVSSGDMPLLAEWCKQRAASGRDDKIDEAEFAAIKDASKERPLSRGESFFAAREKLVSADRQAWLDLNSPFEPLWSELRKTDVDELVILTYKNRQAVVTLCHHYQLLIPPENVYSGDGGAAKTENFEKIRRRFSRTRYYFIDDALHNLQALKKYLNGSGNLELFFAGWGYCGDDDEQRAAAEGFEVFTQETFLRFYRQL